jgi:hypothetical protein
MPVQHFGVGKHPLREGLGWGPLAALHLTSGCRPRTTLRRVIHFTLRLRSGRRRDEPGLRLRRATSPRNAFSVIASDPLTLTDSALLRC